MKTLIIAILIIVFAFIWLSMYSYNSGNQHRYNCWMIENEMRQLEDTDPQYIALSDTFSDMACKPSLIARSKNMCEYLELKMDLYLPWSDKSDQILFEMIDLWCL